MRQLLFLFIAVLFFSCKQDKENHNLSAQVIIDKAIDVACNGNCENVSISFTFRDRHYSSIREGGNFQLERFKTDSIGIIHDVLSNDGLKRYINDSLIFVPDSIASNIGEGVNSVHYFAQLPYGLNAQSVFKKLIGTDTINDQFYYEIEVSFTEEAGGVDFDDTFVYWVHKENFTVDFLAYQYATNGGGMRFREAYNARVVEGIRFVDYNNFKPKSLDTELSNLDDLFGKGELKLLSKIETQNVKVNILK